MERDKPDSDFYRREVLVNGYYQTLADHSDMVAEALLDALRSGDDDLAGHRTESALVDYLRLRVHLRAFEQWSPSWTGESYRRYRLMAHSAMLRQSQPFSNHETDWLLARMTALDDGSSSLSPARLVEDHEHLLTRWTDWVMASAEVLAAASFDLSCKLYEGQAHDTVLALRGLQVATKGWLRLSHEAMPADDHDLAEEASAPHGA